MRTARLERLRVELARLGADAMLVRDTANIHWLTSWDGVFDSERAHALLATADDAVFHTDSRYLQAAIAAEESIGDGVIRIEGEPEAHAAFCARLCAETGVGTLAIEDSMTLAEFRSLEQALDGIELLETSKLVADLRAVKDAEEIARLKAAQQITDAAFAHLVAWLREAFEPGGLGARGELTETMVARELEDALFRLGADSLAFATIAATGANGANPHAIVSDKVLERGQCMVLDFGCVVRGYHSDMTRTVFIGEPSDELRAAYEALRDANETVERALAPGMTGVEAHNLAEQVLESHGFGGKMGHGLGHGVGLEIHEQPNLNTRNDAPLVAGNVVTVEPGIYIPGRFGMRFEDFGVLADGGYEVFTDSTHDMVII